MANNFSFDKIALGHLLKIEPLFLQKSGRSRRREVFQSHIHPSILFREVQHFAPSRDAHL